MRKIIVGNWKCNPVSLKKARNLFSAMRKSVRGIKETEVIICPPFVYLLKAGQGIRLGAQDCFWQEKGAFTGQISPFQLKDLGCQYVIVGHSERRRYGLETDSMINQKLKAVLLAKLVPILCIGETEKERKSAQTKRVLRGELQKDLLGFSKSDLQKLIVAYEPVWAIGTGRACSFPEAKRVNLFLRGILGQSIPVLYGGSVNSKNARGFIQESGFNGFIIGGASLRPREFGQIVKEVEKL